MTTDIHTARHIPIAYRKLYDRAKTGRSQSAAIRSFCLECVAYVCEEVKLCTDRGCPLYEYRLTGRKRPPETGTAHRISPRRFALRETAVESPNGAEVGSGIGPGLFGAV